MFRNNQFQIYIQMIKNVRMNVVVHKLVIKILIKMET